MEDEVVHASWIEHLSSCGMCSYFVFQHQMTMKDPREVLKEMEKKLDDWKKEHGDDWLKPLNMKICILCNIPFDLHEGGCGFYKKHICMKCLEKLPNTKEMKEKLKN